MVIETQEQYKKLLNSIQNKDVAITFVRNDFRSHPSEGKIIVASLCFDSENHDIIFDHSESDSKLDISLLGCVRRFWVDDIKQFFILTGFTNVYDVKLISWVNELEYDDQPIDMVFESIYKRVKIDGNKIIPIVKVIELSRNKLIQLGEMSDKIKITKSALKYNKAAIELAKIEKTGLSTLGDHWYSNYNMTTSTGRPSNTFGGINFAALNKNDGTRKQIISRFESGMLIELDYDAYHLRLLANILNIEFPLNKSLHQHFADEVYKCSYEESKTKSFQILYGNIPVNDNPFFVGVSKLAIVLEDYFNTHKCFKSHIYKKPFNMEKVVDVNRNKLLNYYVQSYETERNYEVIKKLQNYLIDKDTSMILYTYDSFLFDFNIKDGIGIMKGIKNIAEEGGFPVRVKSGSDYDAMKDITARL